MGALFRFGSSAFDLDEVVAVHGTLVVFRDGRRLPVSKKAVEALLAALPEWRSRKRAAPAKAAEKDGD